MGNYIRYTYIISKKLLLENGLRRKSVRQLMMESMLSQSWVVLHYDQGWHSCNMPFADHIGTRMEDGTLAQSKDTVWCEIEVSDKVNYTLFAREQGTNKKGKVIPIKSCLKEIPLDGFYYFQTNPLAKAKWIISGAIKVNRILTDEEVIEICKTNGVKAQRKAV